MPASSVGRENERYKIVDGDYNRQRGPKRWGKVGNMGYLHPKATADTGENPLLKKKFAEVFPQGRDRDRQRMSQTR